MTTKGDKKARPQVVVDELLMKQIASIALTGATYTDIAKVLNLDRKLVSNICNDPKFQEMIKKIGDDELAPAIVRAKARIAKLVDKAVSVLEKHLDDKESLEAVKIVFRAIGMENQEMNAGDATINVILPGASSQSSNAPKTKDLDVIEIT